MKKITLLLLLILTAYSFSAEFNVISFKKNKMDLAGRRNPVNDKEGNPCALIRISSDLENMKCEGDGILKKGRESSGNYYVYISQMSKNITFVSENLNTKVYEFPIPLESTIVYNIELSKNDGLTNLNTVKKLIASEDPDIKGIISNLQVAPFNENIISFEVRSAEDIGMEADKTIKLFLLQQNMAHQL